jgi:hypothetical protein
MKWLFRKDRLYFFLPSIPYLILWFKIKTLKRFRLYFEQSCKNRPIGYYWTQWTVMHMFFRITSIIISGWLRLCYCCLLLQLFLSVELRYSKRFLRFLWMTQKNESSKPLAEQHFSEDVA